MISGGATRKPAASRTRAEAGLTIHLDISQLMLDPRFSGIQRAERELIRHWPGPAPLRPCMFDHASGRMLELPDAVFAILCDEAGSGGTAADVIRLAEAARGSPPVEPTHLVCAELFFDPARAAYYRDRPPTCRAFWLVYDFLPWLHPDWFSIGSPALLMPYLEALRRVDELAFISASTRDDFVTRIGRRPSDGPVIPMGADGLKLERQTFSRDRDLFVMLGTIEPRKNAAPAMQAFQLLWSRGIDARLVMIGASAVDAAFELELLNNLRPDPRFAHLGHCSDEEVRATLRRARAMVFPSEGEGYGIPPMEALHAGIPVVISAGLPAIAEQPAHGQVRLDSVTAETIADSVAALMDDTVCEQMWTAAALMPTAGWRDFSARMAAWVQR